MQLINKNTDYAIRSLLYIAENKDRYVPSRDISRKQEIPLSYVRRLLQSLVKEGFLESKEGVSGGVKLKVDPEAIKISAVINLFQGKVQIVDCMFRKSICSRKESCVVRKRINNIEKKLTDEFDNITIGTLLKDLGEMDEKADN